MKPLIPYIRQSKAKERTISIEDQRRDIAAWAEREGVKLAPEVVEQGVSGSKAWRLRALGKAIEQCEQGKAGGVVVAWQDRLSRENGLATAEVWEALDGYRLVAVNEGLDTATGDHEMIFSIKAAIARDQWKRYQANFARATKNAVENGKHMGRAPYGYRKGEDGILQIHSEEAKTVRAIFKGRIAKRSFIALAREFGMTETRIRSILTGEAYLGTVQHGAFVKLDAHKPIVDRLTFDQANEINRQQTFNAKTGSPASKTLSAGLAECSECGYKLIVSTTTKRANGKQYLNLVCRNPLCSADKMVSISATKVDAVILDSLKFLKGPFARGPLFSAGTDEKEIEAAEYAVQSARHDLDLYNDVEIMKAVGPERFKAKLAEYVETLAKAEKALETVRANQKPMEHSTLTEEWPKWSMEERRAYLAKRIKRILVRPSSSTNRIGIEWGRR